VIILGTIAYLSFSGGRDNKSYYVTIGELQGMGNKAYVRHLRVAGNVAPGSIHRVGTNATFELLEQGPQNSPSSTKAPNPHQTPSRTTPRPSP